jgi:hypothetical protein
MAIASRSIPANYPQPLGSRIQKAEALRQASVLRQEFVTELVAVLAQSKETPVRDRLIKLIETNLRLGMAAARKAEDLWPELAEVREIVEKNAAKPSTARKHLKLFEQFDRVQRRSLALLENSFENIQLILERSQPPDQNLPKPAPCFSGKALGGEVSQPR